MDEDKVSRLLEELEMINQKIAQANKEFNDSDFDLEDMMGHDDSGATGQMTRISVLQAQAESIKSELRKLGYKKA